MPSPTWLTRANSEPWIPRTTASYNLETQTSSMLPGEMATSCYYYFTFPPSHCVRTPIDQLPFVVWRP